MKTTRSSLIVGALTLISANAASAALYTNPPTQHPFSLSLDTGATAWQSASPSLQSSFGTDNWTSTSSVTTSPVVTVVDPLPGVPGLYTITTDTTTTTYNNSHSYQSLSIGYSAGMNGPITVPETYVLSGQISKNSGQTLIPGGYEDLSFNLGMTVTFADPYTPDTANGLLTFKLGNAPGAWTYTFETPFNTGTGSVSFANSQNLDLNTITYFEANYSVGGNPGIQFDIDNLTLNVYGGVNGPYNSSIASVNGPVTNTLYSVVIPALPTAVPVPAAVWLFGSGLLGLIGMARPKAA